MPSRETAPQANGTHASQSERQQKRIDWFNRLVTYLPREMRRNIRNSFLPEDIREQPLPNERVLLEIHLAWYRDILGLLVFERYKMVLFVTLLLTLLIALLASAGGVTIWSALVPSLITATLMGTAFYERLDHLQWRLLKTNARLIISMPQRGSWPLIDNIYIKGLPSVLDTNWSPNPVWRMFQAYTGARDLSVSLAGYQFAEGEARVRDALVIPDLMPEDIYKFKVLVFSPDPPPTRFVTPQEVIIIRNDNE